MSTNYFLLNKSINNKLVIKYKYTPKRRLQKNNNHNEISFDSGYTILLDSYMKH